MDMRDEIALPISVETAWQALNNPEILQQAIPGCLSLEQVSETELAAKVKVKIGPVAATFKGQVLLSELNPPSSYVISGSGTGGVAGSAKGQAAVKLTADGEHCILTYDVSAIVSGKIAQLGSRLVESTAKKLSQQFFDNFTNLVTDEASSS